MKIYISILRMVVLFCFSMTTLTAQETALPAKSVVVYMEIQEDIEIDPTAATELDPTEMLKDVALKGKIIVTLFNEEDIAKIHVKLGTTPGEGDIVQNIFEYDQLATRPFSFERDGETVVLGVGELSNLTTYHTEVILENEAGILSEPKYFSSVEEN